ncbi:MAG: porin [Microthrixaceae bacterium]
MSMSKRSLTVAIMATGLFWAAALSAQESSPSTDSYYADDYLPPVQVAAKETNVAQANAAAANQAAGEMATNESAQAAGYASCLTGCNDCGGCDAAAGSCDGGCGSGCGGGCGAGRSCGCGRGGGVVNRLRNGHVAGLIGRLHGRDTGCCGPHCCDFGDPWTLFDEHCSGFNMGGWISYGSTINSHGNTTGRGNDPLGFNNVADGVVLNQFWLWAGKEADTGGCGSDFGYRVDYIFGTDGPDTQAFGDEDWDFGWNSSRDYGSAIPQLYLEYGYNDLLVKAGHFYTIIGWEVVQAPDNFFYSHSYTMYYGEPFTHTGVLASYARNDRLTLHGGWTAGWDSGFENRLDASTFLGGFSYAVDDTMSLAYALNVGDWGNGRDGLNDGDIYMHSIVMEKAVRDDFTYIIQSDYGRNTNIDGPNTEWYGINQYLIKDLSCCLQFGVRAEWFYDKDGVRVGNGPSDYYGLTMGLNYRGSANTVWRPEVRFDWQHRRDGARRAFSDNERIQMITLGVNRYFTF